MEKCGVLKKSKKHGLLKIAAFSKKVKNTIY